MVIPVLYKSQGLFLFYINFWGHFCLYHSIANMQIRAIDPMFLYYFNIFFKKTFVVSKILFTFAPEKPTYVRVGTI